MTFWQKQGDPAGCMKEEMIRSAHRPDRNDLKIVPKRRIYSYYSQPNRALAARLRATTYGLRWVLPIAEGDF